MGYYSNNEIPVYRPEHRRYIKNSKDEPEKNVETGKNKKLKWKKNGKRLPEKATTSCGCKSPRFLMWEDSYKVGSTTASCVS